MYILYIKNLDTFEQIKSGKKTIEVRRISNFSKQLFSKTLIMFVHQQNYCIKYITKIVRWNTLMELLKNIPLFNINNNIQSIEHAIIQYKKYYKNINKEFYSIHIK